MRSLNHVVALILAAGVWLVKLDDANADAIVHFVYWDRDGIHDTNIESTDIRPFGINAQGQITGYYINTAGEIHGFRWDDDNFVPLGFAPGGDFSVARAINNAGVIVGQSGGLHVDPRVAVKWVNDELEVLPDPPDVILPNAIDINEAGVILITATPETNTFGRTSWLFDGTTFVRIGSDDPAKGTAASALNNHGQVVGTTESLSPTGKTQPFLWDNGVLSPISLSPGISGFGPADINNSGQVVGTGTQFGTVRPFLWENGVFTNLGTLGGNAAGAVAINDRGQVIGVSYITGNTAIHAFLWEHGIMIDLGVLDGFGGSQSFSINNAGTIAGNSSKLILPEGGIPEPSSFALGMLALLATVIAKGARSGNPALHGSVR